ncbi:MAG: diguanylate cyclase [Gammaproteobacteria bacterium]
MFILDEEKLQSMLKQLHQAIYNHERWYNELIRTMVCQLPCDRHDTVKDAHRQCRFGQWYYNEIPSEVRNLQAFLAVGTEHKRMHQLAAELLAVSAAREMISPHDYDAFANALDRLRLEIHTLVREIEESLYNHDPLTGALNRIGMLTSLRTLQELVKRGVQNCSIALMDLDHFKTVNDTYGHRVGDQVLSTLVRYVMEHIRPYDKLYRYGGEEFLITMPSTDLDDACLMLERIQAELARTALFPQGLKPMPVTVSFGLTMLGPEISVEEAIHRADGAPYQAKNDGRNCVRAA